MKFIDRGELGVADLLIQVFKMRSKYGGCNKIHKQLKIFNYMECK